MYFLLRIFKFIESKLMNLTKNGVNLIASNKLINDYSLIDSIGLVPSIVSMALINLTS